MGLQKVRETEGNPSNPNRNPSHPAETPELSEHLISVHFFFTQFDVLSRLKTLSNQHENRTLWPYVTPEVNGQLSFSKSLYGAAVFSFCCLKFSPEVLVLEVLFGKYFFQATLVKRFDLVLEIPIWLQLWHLAYCFSAKFQRALILWQTDDCHIWAEL